MASGVVTVAIPTLNAGPGFADTLAAIRTQVVDRELELLVCDSSSTDGTAALARAHGADLFEIPRTSFSHGQTRNELMARARGDHVAFLTQDAVPVDERWLARLLAGFDLAADAALAFGPYRPRPGASPSVARELDAWFRSFSPDGAPRVDRLEPERRDDPPRAFLGHRGFFTDANGCIARAAWERVPFRPVAYAEDHLLAQDMLRAGYAKVYVPDAAVIHSHEYSTFGWLRRSFDEARATTEVYGWTPASDPRAAVRNLRGNVGADWRSARAAGGAGLSVLTASTAHYGARAAGALLGARAGRLPPWLVARLSLERRGR
jgi:rhamnosyltransferase